MDEDHDSPSSPSDEPQDLSATGRHYAYTSDDELDSEDSSSSTAKRDMFEDNNNIEGYDLSSKREFLASLELERSPEFEEEQDCFVEEFRRMKAKGEFTCRLCTDVFPNLRALKSHNRSHLTGPLFQCNLCPYSSRDRSILMHHMRSHNGDRPFECSICKFAFTTKANCERHLRNRHQGGVTKEASTQMDVPMDLSVKKRRQSDDEEELVERKKPPPDLIYAPPYLPYTYFIPPPLIYQSIHHKDYFRGLQLTGGSLVESNNNHNTSNNNSVNTNNNNSNNTINNNINNNNAVMNNNKKEEVKMVIKNGVLVPKQKQRRYRTERPFGCDHCAARFTLRSNMERHIKQQHPEFWSHRQRGGGRKSNREVRAEPKEIPHGVKAAIVEQIKIKEEKRDGDLASVSKLLDAASAQNFTQFFDRQDDEDDDEEGLVASTSEHSSEERSSPSHQQQNDNPTPVKKKSAYSLAPNRVSCPYCSREFPWSSSLRRHILTHTGQKPYKCDSCPLLFTTKSNCDRHSLRKHGGARKTSSGCVDVKIEGTSDSAHSARSSPALTIVPLAHLQSPVLEEKRKIKDETPGGPCELPFKCHLCDSAFAERQETLDHLKTVHPLEYASLVAKGALESASETEETEISSLNSGSQHESASKDQSNRKVICAFCLRRFWSAEDLRRHMRTHTGERPFSCELCSRRFTLKHSMLRHKKKHKSAAPSVVSTPLVVTPTPSTPPVVTVDSSSPPNESSPLSCSPPTGKGDLISNLLGIKDSRLVDSMLESTAKDAAKLLGIDKT